MIRNCGLGKLTVRCDESVRLTREATHPLGNSSVAPDSPQLGAEKPIKLRTGLRMSAILPFEEESSEEDDSLLYDDESDDLSLLWEEAEAAA